ncbi:autotransporter domain-containing protein [Stakelama saccharophila]|uniref:Autotransporter domain-containing protein n=1 Tax=Stakelama saccharophila TaxID=3075605 RepID=A0ABZ0B739_9SPHN|nr:autotransporter domain-containing protein [Stakelama sp. W311]WNO53242.1 autotransporter domain-containing protein [Stakelama sp. W311]
MNYRNFGQKVHVRRALLLASASVCFGAAGTAQAQSSDVAGPVATADTSQIESLDFVGEATPQRKFELPALRTPEPQNHFGLPTQIAPEPQIVISNPDTPDTAVDVNDVTGIGQMIVDEQNGYIGTCTGTLINPRTVIFAAHCVNEAAATDYGAASGGKPIGFGFGVNNNGETHAFGNWLYGGYDTDVSAAMYNADYVAYNPGSLEEDAESFLYSDVAVAGLDTPAAGIPTWTLLFSALPAPDGEPTASGTGYHVQIQGYGNNGTGEQGVTGSDYRRRAAENMLGALTNLDTFEYFLGSPSNGLYQNLYFLDFDDPRRGTAAANPYDVNAFRDDATPHEGITASGDSGGPLILDDTFDKPVVIGVLSGGYARLFGGASYGYGAVSFYQPLYLYWDWIAANNPYHYVSAKEGDGAWSDPDHWVTDLDPAYAVIDENGNLVNGIPTIPGEGVNGTDGQFGQICIEGPLIGGISDCLDVSTGDETVVYPAAGTGSLSNDKGTASTDSLRSSDEGEGTAPSRTADAAADAPALPNPTLANGLPGASGFVPNNADGDRTTGTAPRYFDVTLSAAGTTTLDETVTIDRFAMANAEAALDIRADGSLTSLMDVTQYSGMMRVDGSLTTGGDYFLMTGGLQGSGTINTPYFTSMAGVIAPGGVGTTGTLDFNGNVILASMNSLMIDLGNDGDSDRVAVHTTMTDADGTPLDGMASIDGRLGFTVASDSRPRDGDVYTIFTAEGGYEGAFEAPQSISAILTPELSYSDTAVTVELEAGSYADVVNQGSPAQSAYAGLLDRNRDSYDRYADLYGNLDLASADAIRATLESYAPRNIALKGALSTAAVDTMSTFFRNRLRRLGDGGMGGTLAMYGRPMAIASAVTANPNTAMPMGGGAGAGAQPETMDDALPGNMSAFLAAGYIDGKSRGMPSINDYGRDEFEGAFLSGGLETRFDDGGVAGIGLSYADMDGDVAGLPQIAKGDLYQATLYGLTRLGTALVLDSQLSAGIFDTGTRRTLSGAGGDYRLSGSDKSLVLSGEVGIGAPVSVAEFDLTPRASMRFSHVDFDATEESGGGPALRYDLGDYDSVQGRLGATADTMLSEIGEAFLTMNYVHDFDEKPVLFGANFAGTDSFGAFFPLPGTDQDWAELSAGGTVHGKAFDFTFAIDTSLWRDDVSNQTYRGTATIHF